MAPGSSGLGKATVGKSGSGAACSATIAGGGAAGALERRERASRADAVHRRVGDRDVAGVGPQADRRHGPQVGVERRVAER